MGASTARPTPHEASDELGRLHVVAGASVFTTLTRALKKYTNSSAPRSKLVPEAYCTVYGFARVRAESDWISEFLRVFGVNLIRDKPRRKTLCFGALSGRVVDICTSCTDQTAEISLKVEALSSRGCSPLCYRGKSAKHPCGKARLSYILRIQFIDFERQLRREQQQHGCGCTIRRLHDKPETMASTGTLCLVFDMCGMVARAALSMFACLFPNSLSGPPTGKT